MHEGASYGVKSSGATSLQGDVPAEVTYSNGDIIIVLQEVLARNLQFHNGIYPELPDSIKLILDNLQFAFIKKHHEVFQQTLRALEIHLVNLTLKMTFTHTTMLTVFQKKPLLQKMTLFLKMRLLEAIPLTIQILQMIFTSVNSLAKRISIQRIK